MTTAARNISAPADLRDRLEYRLYLASAFLVFLPVALFGRLLPRHLRPLGRGAGRASVFMEAMTAARGVAPSIFMG